MKPEREQTTIRLPVELKERLQREADDILSRSRLLKFKINTALFQNCICCMPRFDFSINSNMSVCNWAEPYVMITFAMPFESTIVF